MWDLLGRQWDVKLQHAADLLAKRGKGQAERIIEYAQSLSFFKHAIMFDWMGQGVDRLCPSSAVDNPMALHHFCCKYHWFVFC